ncbi:MAG: PorV/PorQ family protein [Candidatus Cloacimonetes bacterium]|nr:PorV/PorQ family protein [Candidatus Cloacimonadota bacterium]
MRYRLLIILLIAAGMLFAINEKAGTSGFSFFKLNFSPRAAALGGAYTGLADDLQAVFFNPAGLIQITQRQASLSYLDYFEGIQCGAVVFAYPRNEYETYAVFAQFLTASEERTYADEFGELVETGENFGMTDLLLGFSAARYLTGVLNIGVNIKYLQESLDNNTATAVAADISLLHQTTNKNVKIGIALKNLGWQLSYYTDSEYKEKLPMVGTIGFSYHPNEKLYLILDISKPMEFDVNGQAGIEYRLHEMLCLRAGYKSAASDWQTGGDYDFLSGFSVGLGLNWGKYSLDYAFSSYGDLGITNLVGLKYKF